MATDETHDEETEVAAPEVNADQVDPSGTTDDEAEAEVDNADQPDEASDKVDSPGTDNGDTTPPEHTTPAAGGPDLEVPSAAGPADSPTDVGNAGASVGGDVDVASVDPGTGKGELVAPVSIEDYVILGKHSTVPEHLVGRRAAVIAAPNELYKVGEEDKVWLTVKTRDEYNATLVIPLSATTAVEKYGQSHTVRG